jgi:hypothetical protein
LQQSRHQITANVSRSPNNQHFQWLHGVWHNRNKCDLDNPNGF